MIVGFLGVIFILIKLFMIYILLIGCVVIYVFMYVI